MQLGGDVLFEDPSNIGDVSAIVSTGGGSGSGSITITTAEPILTDGVDGLFSNNHITFTSWDSALTPFMTNSGGTVGLFGEFGSGRIVLTGPDHDYHASRPNDQYEALLNEYRWVSDDAGLTVTVNNVDPVIDSLAVTSVDENGTVHLTGTYSDVGTQDTHEITIDWGEGSPQTVALSGGSFDITHQYLDDDPSNTGSDVYTVNVTVTDDDTGTDAGSVETTITNVAPVLTVNDPAPLSNKGAEGEPITLELDFTDPGTLDVHTVDIDWGDGNTHTVDLTVGDRSLSIDHTYAAGGVYYIDATVTDDDTGADSVLDITAVISGVSIQTVAGEDVLQVIGTAGDDHISINQTGNGDLKVHWDFLGDDPRVFPLADIDRIMSILCDGDDHLTISGKVTLPTIIDAGGGNDHINGGAGSNIILGGDGDDHLNGGDARDIIIGGNGADRIVGGPGYDILAGDTYSDADAGGAQDLLSNYDSLLAVQERWLGEIDDLLDDPTSDAVLADFYAAVGGGDGAVDMLTGSSGFDWLLLFEDTDVFTDAASNGNGNGGGKGKNK